MGRSPEEENGNLPQYCCLENPMDRGAWPATQLCGGRRGERLGLGTSWFPKQFPELIQPQALDRRMIPRSDDRGGFLVPGEVFLLRQSCTKPPPHETRSTHVAWKAPRSVPMCPKGMLAGRACLESAGRTEGRHTLACRCLPLGSNYRSKTQFHWSRDAHICLRFLICKHSPHKCRIGQGEGDGMKEQ